ncbi:MAG TPA: universal stress protein [Candidatus Dormibacteraeota bacterium]|nr:universal stress protein [Candidatus Dormibacteraeota bacterium]
MGTGSTGKGAGYRKILFAVDASVHMRAAGPAVGRLAQATRAEVVILHVSDAGGPAVASSHPPEEVERMARGLRDFDVEPSVLVRHAPTDQVAETIVAVAREFACDLIALGSRGLSDLSGLFKGSVSHRVIAASDCPVMVVRYGMRRRGGPIHRLLLAVAGGEEVEGAYEAAATIAKPTGAEVLVLHARYLIAGLDHWPYVESDAYAQREVLTIVKRFEKAGIRARTYSPVALAGIAHEIAAEARTWDADLVVIGSHRLSDLASLLLGGIDHDVIHLGEQPVLIAKRPTAQPGARR